MFLGFGSVGLTSWNAPFIILSIVWIIVGRFFAILILSAVIQLLFSDSFNPAFSWSEQLIIFHAGLRGSIALSLAMTLPNIIDVEIHELIIAATTIIVIWTVFFNGGTTALLLRLLKEERPTSIDFDHCEACKARKTFLTPREHSSLAFNEKWILPFLTHAKRPRRAVQPSETTLPDQDSSVEEEDEEDFPDAVPTRALDAFLKGSSEREIRHLHHHEHQMNQTQHSDHQDSDEQLLGRSPSAYPKARPEQRSHRNLISSQMIRDASSSEEIE